MTNIATEQQRLEEAGEWLITLQEEDVPDAEIVRWVDWCELHPENRKAFERLLPLWQAFDARATAPLPLAQRREWKPQRRFMALAASIVLAVAITAVFFVRSGRPQRLEQVAAVQTRLGEIKPLLLPDGSQVDLGARSSMALDFRTARREVQLGEGEAFFSVKADPTRPFVVRAGKVEITAVGTQFNVLKGADRVVVTVQQGSVRVSGSAAEPVLARAGHQVVSESGQARPDLHAIDPASSIAWRRGHLEYISEPLSDVVGTLNRYARTQLVFEDPALGALNYTGTIEVDSLEEWLRALPRIFPVRLVEKDGQIRIGRRP